LGQNVGRILQLGEGLGLEVGHTAAAAVIVVRVLLVHRAPPLKSTSATLHPI
jgi:hypothetical protein